MNRFLTCLLFGAAAITAACSDSGGTDAGNGGNPDATTHPDATGGTDAAAADAAAGADAQGSPDATPFFSQDEWDTIQSLANLPDPPPDNSNKYVTSTAAVALGQKFYFDPGFA